MSEIGRTFTKKTAMGLELRSHPEGAFLGFATINKRAGIVSVYDSYGYKVGQSKVHSTMLEKACEDALSFHLIINKKRTGGKNA